MVEFRCIGHDSRRVRRSLCWRREGGFLCDRIKVFVEYLYFSLIFVSINECVRNSYRLCFADVGKLFF